MRARHLLTTLLSLLPAQGVLAQEGNPIGELPVIGTPAPGGIGFQPAATSLAEDLVWLDGMVLIIITVITFLVIGLLAAVLVLYNRRANPDPKSFTHNTPVEIAWTIGPIIVLIFIGAFSLPVLFDQQEIPEGEITIKTTGYQWYWGYEYPDHEFGFDSYMIGSPATGGDNRLTDEVRQQLQEAGYSEDEFKLATDTAMVVPVDTDIVLQVTGADVIHSWTIPAFGVKQDAVPGRLAELWFNADEEGVYFGQCSELCGIAHAYMPITVKVVSREEYDAWLDWAIAEYGGTPRETADASAAQQGDGAEGQEGTSDAAEGGEANADDTGAAEPAEGTAAGSQSSEETAPAEGGTDDQGSGEPSAAENGGDNPDAEEPAADGATGGDQTGDGQAEDGQASDGQTGDGQTGDGQTGDGQTGDGQTGDDAQQTGAN